MVLPFVNSYAAQGDVSIATSKVLQDARSRRGVLL